MRNLSKPLGSLWNLSSLGAALLCLVLSSAASAQRISVNSTLQKGDFKLVFNKRSASILVAPEDAAVVQIAAGDLALDVERVTGIRPAVVKDAHRSSPNAVIAGTLGKSALVGELAARGKIDIAQLRGKWESFLIATVKNPLPNIDSALLIVGSDRRGTAFGIYELSQSIGVSPWYWWADVTPEHRDDLLISPGTFLADQPSVRYRGIFLNDEDWGLQPWAAKTFEPETVDIGPKTYSKIFELLLRLKANTLWPAMHEVTRPFNSNPKNRKVADDYAIVMGSSHAEPMLRNNVREWKHEKNSYNFVTNPRGVTEYWEQRIRDNGRYENVYTIGMRGIHDSPILGTKSQAERITLLEKIFSVQRGLIAKHVLPDIEKVPQIFCPYKEVLADYRAGLSVPDDVTIVFPDDNFGYIRQVPSVEEQKRKGGFGVYYHISYLGRPLSYLWLNSTPPALIWQEMSKAYENGMREIWIVNVGDIKPGEIGMEFFLQMAYDAGKWTVENQHEFLREWARREFGSSRSADIAAILDRYYRLGFQRKPEHLQWFLPNEPQQPSDLTHAEKLNRLEAYSKLRKRADEIYRSMSQSKKDPFYELVLYPIRSAALANERFFAAEMATGDRTNWSPTPVEWAKRSIAADTALAAEANYFNETLAGGKWRYIMSPEMESGQWPSMRTTAPKIVLTDVQGSKEKPKNGPPPMIPDLRNDIVSIEAEHFRTTLPAEGFEWKVIKGLGKTGDSVSLVPARTRTFDDRSPSLEYRMYIETAGELTAYFHLVPTQPLVPGVGLRFAFSIDGRERQVVVVDKETEVSSRKWAQNILDQTTVGTAKISLTKGNHTLRIFAVDTGVVMDKIVIASRKLPTSYFGPPETGFAWR
ncbi:MAG TPA: glycosyl hydrolase 115 family protein [Pyrinomonadaceae bacterium]|nr:glycosyl hydrolase 115 family protein [Pyrinomonadaceae bacterium]